MMGLAVNEDQVTPGVVAFLIVAALGVTLWLLIRSMNRHIRRIEAPSEDELRQADWERHRQEKQEQERVRATQGDQAADPADQSER